LSERGLRMMKLRQNISGTFRSVDALVDCCRTRGYVSTARKKGLNARDALHRAFAGDPFVPETQTSTPAPNGQRRTSRRMISGGIPPREAT